MIFYLLWQEEHLDLGVVGRDEDGEREEEDGAEDVDLWWTGLG